MKIKSLLRGALLKFIGYGGGIPFLSSVTGSYFMRRKSAETDPLNAFAGWVYFAIKIIANRVSATPLDVYVLKGDAPERVEDHAIIALLERPNPIMDKVQMLGLVVTYLKLFGAAPLFKIRKGRRIVGLFPMRPDLLSIKQKPDGTVSHYEFRAGGKVERFSTEDVVYIRDPDPRDVIRGYSSLSASALEVDVDAAAAIWNKYYMERHGEPDVVLETEHELSDAVYKRLRDSWEERYGGPTNAGKVAILEGGVKIGKTGRKSPSEAGYMETRKNSKQAILSILGVPEGFFAKDTTYANAKVAEETLAKYTVDPMLRLIVSQLNAFLVPQIDDTAWLDYESPVTEDRKTVLDETRFGVNVWLTINEARARYSLPPLDGGDVLYVRSQGTQVGDGEQPKALQLADGLSRKQLRIKSAILARSHNSRKALHDVVQRVKARRALNRLRKKQEEKKVVRLTTKSAKDEPTLPEALVKERKAYLATVDKREEQFTDALRAYFSQQQSAVIEKVAQVFSAKAHKDTTIPAVVEEVMGDNDALAKILSEQYGIDFEHGVVAIAGLLRQEAVDILGTDAAKQFLEENPPRFANEINIHTRDELTLALQEGIDEGDAVDELSARVARVFDEARDYRSERIARTEVGRAQNFARWQEMKALGATHRIWTAVFRNTRASHAEADGQIVGIDEPFTIGGHHAMYPSDPSLPIYESVNCQCSVAPEIEV